MLTGTMALARALGAARVRSAWSFPGAPVAKLSLSLDAGTTKGLHHRYATSDHAAVSMALGGALLRGNNTCAIVKHLGLGSALEVMATFGTFNELGSGCLIIEGVDPAPIASHNAQDNRSALARLGHLLQLEPVSADEIYHFVRIGARLSERTGMPVVVRVGARGLDAEGIPRELPPDPIPGEICFSRTAGPYVCTASTYRFHVDKRRRLLKQLPNLLDALTVRSAGTGPRGVVLAGHLGPRLQNQVCAHGLPSLRLGSSFPLPRRALIEFLAGLEEVLVLEEGEPVLEEGLANLACREGMSVRIRSAEGSRPLVLDEPALPELLERFCPRGEPLPEIGAREALGWKRAYDAADGVAEDDGEPWPLYLGRVRRAMKGLPTGDPRATLLETLRRLERPTIIVGDPGNTAVAGIRDRLVDVKMHMGSAVFLAAALGDAAEVDERSGAPLAVALMSDTNLYHSGLLGIVENAIMKRDVLHVVFVNPTAEASARTPSLGQDALEAMLRGAGVHVSTVSLGDPELANAVAYAAHRIGTRALLCIAEGRDEGTAEP